MGFYKFNLIFVYKPTCVALFLHFSHEANKYFNNVLCVCMLHIRTLELHILGDYKNAQLESAHFLHLALTDFLLFYIFDE